MKPILLFALLLTATTAGAYPPGVSSVTKETKNGGNMLYPSEWFEVVHYYGDEETIYVIVDVWENYYSYYKHDRLERRTLRMPMIGALITFDLEARFIPMCYWQVKKSNSSSPEVQKIIEGLDRDLWGE